MELLVLGPMTVSFCSWRDMRVLIFIFNLWELNVLSPLLENTHIHFILKKE